MKKKQKEVQADSEVPENDDVLTDRYLDQASEERDDDFAPSDSVKDAYNEFKESDAER